MKRLGIAKRLALMFVLAVVLLSTVSALLLRCSLKESLMRQVRHELNLRHQMLDPLLASRGTPELWQPIRNKLTGLTPTDGSVGYWIVSENPDYRFGDELPRRYGWADLPDGWHTQPIAGRDCPLELLIRTIPAQQERPPVRFVVALDSTPFLETLASFTRTLVLTSVLGVLLVGGLGYWIARFGLRPLRRLSQQAHRLPPGDSRQRLDTVALPAELSELASAFNGALERQEKAWNQLEGFNANVAHELRTPLTNLIGQTQVGLVHGQDVQELQELLQSNLEELERMGGIVNDMLFLASAESGQRVIELSDVSLSEESRKTLEYLEPMLQDKDLNVSILGDMSVRIDKRLFHRSLANLVQNAARHSAPGSALSIRLVRQQRMVEVSVSNPGEAIEPAQLARLFERFYRADAARSRSDAHHGLGLSIVRAVAGMHGGQVFARSEGGLNTFGFTLVSSEA